ncbi:MAG: hypothetical protein AAB483_00760 [Patescibacteria group bacterium]
MNPKSFHLVGGIVLALVGLLGLLGVLDSVFGDLSYMVYLIVGIIAMIGSFVFPMGLQKIVALLIGIIALLLGLYNLFLSGDAFLGMNLGNSAAGVLDLIVGIWALLSVKGKPATMGGGMPSSM